MLTFFNRLAPTGSTGIIEKIFIEQTHTGIRKYFKVLKNFFGFDFNQKLLNPLYTPVPFLEAATLLDVTHVLSPCSATGLGEM